MTSDLAAFLSGDVPLGVALLPLAIGAFSLTWWFTWRGTEFWSSAKFYRVLVSGCAVIAAAYAVLWSLNPSPPIPIRILIVNSAVSSGQTGNAWRAAGLEDALRRILAVSEKPITVLARDLTPAIDRADDYESLAHRLKARWMVRIRPFESDDGSQFSLDLNRITNSSRREIFKSTSALSPFSLHVESIAEEVCTAIGLEKANLIFNGALGDSSIGRCFHAIQTARVDKDSAAAVFAQLADLHPNWRMPRLELARLLIDSAPAAWGDSIHSLLLDCIDLDGGDPEPYILLGRLFLERRMWDEAESALKLALNVTRDDPRVYFYLSRLEEFRLQDSRWDNKLKLLKRALHISPGYETARLTLAKLRIRRRERHSALSTLKEGLHIDPGSVDLRLSASAALIEMNRHSDAVRQCEIILELSPDNARALYNLGIARIWLEEYEPAIESLKNSLAHGGSIENYFYLGVAYERMRDWNEAIRYYQRRLASPKASDDMHAISARERIQLLQLWIAESDSG